MGLAIGAGFYECVVLCTVLIFLCMRFLPIIENYPPPAWKGKYIKIKYITQLPAGQVPSFVFFCNLPQWIKEPYKRFLENKIRESFGFEGTPLKFVFREKGEKEDV